MLRDAGPAAADTPLPGSLPAGAVLPEQRFAQPVTGAAYRASARWAIIGVCAGLFSYGVRVLVAAPAVAPPVLALLAAGAVVVLAGAWSVLTGKTTIDARGIRQHGVFTRDLRWSEIAAARHVRMPMTSRLVISTGSGPFKAIHSGTPGLDTAFAAVAALYARRAGAA